MLNPTIKFGDSFILWTMFYEALLWPPMNNCSSFVFYLRGNILWFYIANFLLVGLLWHFLILSAAIYCVAAEKKNSDW